MRVASRTESQSNEEYKHTHKVSHASIQRHIQRRVVINASDRGQRLAQKAYMRLRVARTSLETKIRSICSPEHVSECTRKTDLTEGVRVPLAYIVERREAQQPTDFRPPRSSQKAKEVPAELCERAQCSTSDVAKKIQTALEKHGWTVYVAKRKARVVRKFIRYPGGDRRPVRTFLPKLMHYEVGIVISI